MITSSPGCQLTGVATLFFAISSSESRTRSTSSKFRPVVTCCSKDHGAPPFPASLFFVLVAKWRTWFNVRHGKRPRTILPDREGVGSLRDALDTAHLARADD